MTAEAVAGRPQRFRPAAARRPVTGHLTAAGHTLPGHPVRPQEDVAAPDRRRKQRTVNPPIVRYNFLYGSFKAGLREGLVPRPVLGRNDTTATGEPALPITPGKRWPNRARADLSLLVDSGQSEPLTRTRRWFCEPGPVRTGMQW
jgi:hypothetical protein